MIVQVRGEEDRLMIAGLKAQLEADNVNQRVSTEKHSVAESDQRDPG